MSALAERARKRARELRSENPAHEVDRQVLVEDAELLEDLAREVDGAVRHDSTSRALLEELIHQQRIANRLTLLHVEGGPYRELNHHGQSAWLDTFREVAVELGVEL